MLGESKIARVTGHAARTVAGAGFRPPHFRRQRPCGPMWIPHARLPRRHTGGNWSGFLTTCQTLDASDMTIGRRKAALRLRYLNDRQIDLVEFLQSDESSFESTAISRIDRRAVNASTVYQPRNVGRTRYLFVHASVAGVQLAHQSTIRSYQSDLCWFGKLRGLPS